MPRVCVAGTASCARRSGARPTSASPTSRSASCWRRRSRATTSRSTPCVWPRRDFEKARRVPGELIAEIAPATAAARVVRHEARQR